MNYFFSAQPFNLSLGLFQMEVMLCRKEQGLSGVSEPSVFTAICQTGLITRSLNNSIQKSKSSLSYPSGTLQPGNSTDKAMSTTATAEQPCTQLSLSEEAPARVRAHCQFVRLTPNPCWAVTLKSAPLRVVGTQRALNQGIKRHWGWDVTDVTVWGWGFVWDQLTLTGNPHTNLWVGLAQLHGQTQRHAVNLPLGYPGSSRKDVAAGTAQTHHARAEQAKPLADTSSCYKPTLVLLPLPRLEVQQLSCNSARACST